MFLKWPSPGNLNASIETIEQIRVKATELFIVNGQGDMLLQLSKIVLLYDEKKAREEYVLVGSMRACIFV